MTQAFVGATAALVVAHVAARDGVAAGAWMYLAAGVVCVLCDGLAAGAKVLARKLRAKGAKA
jgi:Na+/H+ antiporter NhaD/arsenite permease-like protein